MKLVLLCYNTIFVSDNLSLPLSLPPLFPFPLSLSLLRFLPLSLSPSLPPYLSLPPFLFSQYREAYKELLEENKRLRAQLGK
jgi:hypothetical protein